MTKQEFIYKYREKFGCDGSSEICWCNICCALETIWEEIIGECKNKLEILKEGRDEIRKHIET